MTVYLWAVAGVKKCGKNFSDVWIVLPIAERIRTKQVVVYCEFPLPKFYLTHIKGLIAYKAIAGQGKYF